jgi:two-component system, LytTR family, response regulator
MKYKKLNSIIVDTNFDVALSIKNFCKSQLNGDLIVDEIFIGTGPAQNHLNDNMVDLVFVSLNSEKINAYQFIEEVGLLGDIMIIAYGDSIDPVKAIRLPIFEYLQMPLMANDLNHAFMRIYKRKLQESNIVRESNISVKKILINGHERAIFVNLDNVIRVEAQGSYTDFYMENGSRISSTKSINHYENILDKSMFYKIHRSHIISITKIKEVIKDDGDGILVMTNGNKINISRSKKNEFLKFLQQYY